MNMKRLSLSAQIEVLKAELEWLASNEESCPSDEISKECRKRLDEGVASDCTKCWLDAAHKTISESK